MSEEFYGTDLKESAIDDLEKLSKFVELAKQDKTYWKWVIIAIHSSLYNFMLLALSGGSVYSEIWERVEKKKVGLVDKIEFFDSNPNPKKRKLFNPKNRIICFQQAFKRIKDAKKMGGKAFVSNPDIDEAMEVLNTELRNQFIHFKPVDWLIETNFMKKIIQEVLPIISFITSEFRKEGIGRVRVLIEENEQLAVSELLKKIISETQFK